MSARRRAVQEPSVQTQTVPKALPRHEEAATSAPPRPGEGFGLFWLGVARFTVLAAAVWLMLYALTRSFPFVQNGAAVVGQQKWAAAQAPGLFSTTADVRVVVFGNSKILAGFDPAVFERELGGSTSAYNLAIPGEERFVELLQALLKAGNRPTHLLIQSLPSQQPADGWLARLRDDKALVQGLFPFRGYLRDAVIFIYEARKAGGLQAQYRANARQIERLQQDRGYYFIKSQSHFPGDRLPDHFSLPTDMPNKIFQHKVDAGSPALARLLALSAEYRFKIILIPVAYRSGELAPAPAGDAALEGLIPGRQVAVLGPGYLLYPPSMFSDPVHLNPAGARQYTTQLAQAFKRHTEER